MLAGAPTVAFSESDLLAAGSTRLTQRRTVSAASGVGVEQSTVYDGVLLRDVLARTGLAAATDRSLRTGLVEAIATDGYRAIFSWGELYNAAVGDQVLVIRSQDGTALDAVAGPLAFCDHWPTFDRGRVTCATCAPCGCDRSEPSA